MALKNIKHHLECITTDTGDVGVVKTDQIELVDSTSTPTINLSNGRIFYSADDKISVYINGNWKHLVTG